MNRTWSLSTLILSHALFFAGPAVAAEPPQPGAAQRRGAAVGFSATMTTQALAMTTAILLATDVNMGDPILAQAPGMILNAPISALGVASFEGLLRDGTAAGHYRGLGAGLLQGGLHSLVMAGVLAAGKNSCTPKRSTNGCLGDPFSLFVFVPGFVSYLALGNVMTGVGVGLLARAERMDLNELGQEVRQPRAQRIRLTPLLAPTPKGFHLGLAGVF